MEWKRIVLASASPRRKELLNQIGIKPEIMVSHVVETVTLRLPEQVVMELAVRKALDVLKNVEAGTLVIGADTVVAVDGEILGKPSDHEDAARMVTMIAGRSHQVYTGVCLVLKGEPPSGNRIVKFYDETDVEVYPMTEEEIKEYACLEEPMDKAGAYAVQGIFARYIKGLKGSYANVMGLPVSRLYKEMKRLAQ